MHGPIQALAAAIQQGQPAVLATVIEIQGASPAKVGAQIVLLADVTTTHFRLVIDRVEYDARGARER